MRFSATADSDGLAVASVVSSANWKVDEVHCFGSLTFGADQIQGV